MIMLFDSSAMQVKLSIINGAKQRTDYVWEAGRTLARDMLQFLQDKLAENGLTFDDVTGIGVCQGPGSYTGLRIGLTVLNTIAESKGIPIVGASGADWSDACLRRLEACENDKLVMPNYGGEAHTTLPRK